MSGPIPFTDSWAMAEGELDGFPLVLRFRDRLKSILGHPRLPNRLHVIWVYDSEPVPGAHAMPSQELSDRMSELEDALTEALEERSLAVLTSVATSGGRREWTWYCADKETVQTAINDALAGSTVYPVRLRVSPDPTWSGYMSLLRDLGRDAA